MDRLQRKPARAALLVAVASIWAACAVPAQAAASKQEQVEALFGDCTKQGRPGGAISIMEGGQTVYEGYYGSADIGKNIPISARTQFNVASVSKQFTGFAALLLIREGKIDVEADIRRYLPFMPDYPYVIRVKHLLSQTSGLHDHLELMDFSGHDTKGVIRRQAVLNMLSRQRTLISVPGTQYHYTNTNFVLLGEIVQKVSGKSIRDFLRERVFQPLGMTNSDMVDDMTEIMPQSAFSYRFDERRQAWSQIPYTVEMVGSTGLLTTVGDMAKWLANFAHPKVGDAALIRQFTTPSALNDGTPVKYNFGLGQGGRIGLRAWEHSGSEAAFGSQLAYFPDYDVGIFVVMNGVCQQSPGALLDDIARIWLPIKKEATPLAPKTRRPSAALTASLQGLWVVDLETYRDAKMKAAAVYGAPFTVSLTQGQLMAQPVVTYPGRVVPAARFLLGADDVLRTEGGSSYRLRRAADGTATALELIEGADRPVAVYKRSTFDALSAAQLEQYAGNYRHKELDVTYTVSVENSRLSIRSFWNVIPTAEFAQTGRDQFDTAIRFFGTIVFDRDTTGRPNRFRIEKFNLTLDRVD